MATHLRELLSQQHNQTSQAQYAAETFEQTYVAAIRGSVNL